ncbi:MAG: helix-turn-helix transcriptional regulator, partial [Pseudonocardiaceae bacterium]
QRIELQPLSEEETGELVTAVLGGPLNPATTRQLWNVTRGNTLYLRHLVEQGIASNRLATSPKAAGLSAGVWAWKGPPVISPGLADLIDTQIGELPQPVGTVLDFLAVGEPLTEQMLADLTDPDAVEQAHSIGLITVDQSGLHPVRLAHPLYGEVRRAVATPLRLCRLRAQVADALSSIDGTDLHDLVRRAVLTLESDLTPDPALLTTAATAAQSMFDAELAVRLCNAAIANGAGYDAHLTLSRALTRLGRGEESEHVLTQLITQSLTDEQIVEVASHRLGPLLWILNRPAEAEAGLLDVRDTTSPQAHHSLTACHAIVRAYEGWPLNAVEAAERALRPPRLSESCTMWALTSLLIALGDLGKT